MLKAAATWVCLFVFPIACANINLKNKFLSPGSELNFYQNAAILIVLILMSIISFHCSHGEIQLYAVRTYNICSQSFREKNVSSKKVQRAKAKHLSHSVIKYKPIKILIRISLVLTKLISLTVTR